MKTLIAIAICCLALVVAEEDSKGGFCHDNNGCRENQCCFGKVCHNKVAEGGRCIFRELICGCMPGLKCQRTAFVTMRCLKPPTAAPTTAGPTTAGPTTAETTNVAVETTIAPTTV